jgi:hypothetical protein
MITISFQGRKIEIEKKCKWKVQAKRSVNEHLRQLILTFTLSLIYSKQRRLNLKIT